MDHLKKFLEKFSKIRDPKEDRLIISKILSDIANINVSPDSFEVTSGFVRINTHPLVKTQIKLNWEQIKKELDKYPQFKNLEIK